MKQIVFRDLNTSSLGFGCVSLTLHDSLKQAVEVLETAFELGITHFDVARGYGSGRCEYILGKFISGRREKVTVTTKFGINPPIPGVNHHIIDVVKRIINRFPMLRAKAHSAVRAVSRRTQESNRFSVAEAARSLETSLNELHTDYIDVFLLHECSLQEANSPELLEFLERAVRDGKIRYYGLATAFSNLPVDIAEIDAAHSVVQTENSAIGGYLEHGSPTHHRLFIGHGIFKNLDGIHKTLVENLAAQPQNEAHAIILRDALDSGKEGLAKLMLLSARCQNPDGIVLFSSVDRDNIKANVDAWVSKDRRPAEVNALEEMLARLSICS